MTRGERNRMDIAYRHIDTRKQCTDKAYSVKLEARRICLADELTAGSLS